MMQDLSLPVNKLYPSHALLCLLVIFVGFAFIPWLFDILNNSYEDQSYIKLHQHYSRYSPVGIYNSLISVKKRKE